MRCEAALTVGGIITASACLAKQHLFMPLSLVDSLKSDLLFPPCTLALLHQQY